MSEAAGSTETREELIPPIVTQNSGGGRILRQYELVDRVKSYDPSADEALLNKAYVYSVKSHGTQKRHSGEPYFAHPVEVAGILTNLKMDVPTICTALLHDVLEDTHVTEKEMTAEFGEEITELVKGVTKLSLLELKSNETKQAENFQKFVLAISKDLRVLLVKLADRLHNMRTLHHVPKKEKRELKARETLEIYAPLARRIGVETFCGELEDLAFFHLNPSAFHSIHKRLSDTREERQSAVANVTQKVTEMLEANDIDARMYGREKRAYSIWRKLERQAITFDALADIYAFRIIVNEADECYRVLGLLHQNWRCVPSRFRDFISTPKLNGYASLHTTILGPDNRRIEIQIRTEQMEEVAERGVAAHWRYKNENYTYDTEAARAAGMNPLERLRPLVEILEHGGDPDEFLENAKLEIFADQVFTFTPKGDLITLPRGATPLDFAYALHTNIGDTCIGATINGRERPLRTRLSNGDVVKVIRGGQAEPQANWENIVVTGRARSAIRRLVRRSEAEEFAKVGRMLVERAFARKDLDFAESILTDALTRLSVDSIQTLYTRIGKGELAVTELMDALYPGREDLSQEELKERAHHLIDDLTARFYVKGEGLTPGISIHFSDCCSPLPGDRIVGILSPGEGVHIHTIDCENLAALENQEERWLDIGWTRAVDHSVSTGRVAATLEHVPGALAEVTRIVGESGGNISNIRTLRRSPTFFDMIFDIEVLDARHLSQIVAAMRANTYVVSARRARADSLED